MMISISLIRFLVLTLSTIFFTAYAMALTGQQLTLETGVIGLLGGVAFAALLIVGEILLRRFTIRSFNIAILGLFFGYLMGTALLLITSTVSDWANLDLPPELTALCKIALYMITCYAGMVMTARAGEDFYMIIPFVKFNSSAHHKKDVLLDSSVLMDPRVIDLATSGLLDHQLVLPRFTFKELQAQSESNEDFSKLKARRCLETIKRLEKHPLP